MGRLLILTLCLTLVANGITSIEKRSLEFDQGKENTHEFPHDASDVSEIENEKNIENQQHSDQDSVKLESNGHGGNEFDGAFHYSGREGEGHVISNQHLGAHEYYTHHSGEEGKLIEHGDGFINKESSNEGGRELSGGISYQHVRTGDHSTINSDPNVQDIFKDHHATLEKYRTYTKQEGHGDHVDIKGNNNYGYQGAEDHIQLSFGNLLNHQEPEIHEVTKVVPVHETIKIPEPHKVQKLFKIPVPVKVLEPFPIRIPVPYAVEKTVHVPVEKIIKYQVEKPVPVRVEKEVPVAVVKPYPVPFPVYKIKLIIHSGGPSYEE